MTVKHWSSCAVHNEPAYPAGPCDCGGLVKELAMTNDDLQRLGQAIVDRAGSKITAAESFIPSLVAEIIRLRSLDIEAPKK